jgi:hypothetical protein
MAPPYWQEIEVQWHNCHFRMRLTASKIWVTGAPARTKPPPQDLPREVRATMELVVLFILIALLGAASLRGWVADSHESGDWQPTDDGRRTLRPL